MSTELMVDEFKQIPIIAPLQDVLESKVCKCWAMTYDIQVIVTRQVDPNEWTIHIFNLPDSFLYFL